MSQNPDFEETSARRKWVETACGSEVELNEQTPWVNYRDEVVYFCQQQCKVMYEQDPRSSCLAARILMGK